MRRIVTIGFALAVAAGSLPLHAQAQAPLAHVRDLYSNAAYEDVLSAVAADATASPQIGQYKVFSLIALGRPADAEQAAESVLATHLGFHPDGDASPRLVDLFASVRRRMAPDLVKTMYTSARALLDKKDRDGAIEAFTDVLALTSDPDLKDDKTVAEMGLLANGFLELSKALPTAAPAPGAADASAARPDAASAPTGAAASNAPRRSGPPVITLPTAIRQDLPKWDPPPTVLRMEYKGKILVHVGADGKVEGSEIVEPVHPLYDDLLLRASKNWLYKPGMSNGTPVPSERMVEVVLKPRAS
jgi:hypothetical protein